MPIQVKAPDGSIAQFPDGMADADIEKVMAQHYPQPSFMDRVAAFPLVRGVHDVIGGMIGGALNGPMQVAAAANNLIPNTTPMDVNNPTGLDASYNDALSRNRNAPGYAAARAGADKAMALRGGSGITDQLLAPFLPAVAGTAGLLGGLDSSNAMADAQAEGQGGYAARHPVLSAGANILGGFLTGAPEGIAKNLPVYAGDNPLVTRAINPDAMGPLPLDPRSTPVSPAVDYVRGLVAKSGKTPTDLTTFDTGGKPVTSAEAIGKPGEVGLGALARREGATPDALSGAIRARNEAAPQRILSDYAAASGIDPLAARGDIEGFIEANQKAATPLYTEAYKANPNISSPMLDRILETPAGRKALASARDKMQNDMSLMGTPDAELMDQAREGDTPIPARGVASGMKLRVYDYVKKSLDDQIGAAYRAGNKNEGGIINDLKNTMLRELDKADVTAAAGPNSVKPEGGLYAQARAKAGEYLSARKQFEAGQEHILDHNFPAQDFAAYYAKLGPADQQAYLGGVANKLFNIQQANKLKADIFKAPVIQQKLATIMGPEKARAFLRNMESEAKMAAFARTRVPGAGSPTAEYVAAMKDQDSAGLLPEALGWVGQVADKGPIKGSISYGVGRGKDALAAYATRGMPVGVRDEAGRMLMLPPQQLGSDLARLPTLPVKGPARLPPPLLGLLGSRVRSAP